MRIYTAHLAPGRAPLLVREGFSLGAFLFGPLWLFAHRAWVAGAIALAVLVGIGVLAVLTAGSTLPLITLLATPRCWAGTAATSAAGRSPAKATRKAMSSRLRTGESAYARLIARDPTLAAADLL